MHNFTCTLVRPNGKEKSFVLYNVHYESNLALDLICSHRKVLLSRKVSLSALPLFDCASWEKFSNRVTCKRM